MKAYSVSSPGLVRPNNEDCYYIDDQLGLLVVADGMGGHAGGETASSLAVQQIYRQLQHLDGQPDILIKDAMEAANKSILAHATSHPQLSGMGTTLTLARVMPDFLIVGHIGDSRAFLIDCQQIKRLTSDHSVSGQLLASGKITDSEAENHPQRHVLTKVLGKGEQPEVEVVTYPWSSGQFCLLCSDGLTDVVSDAEIFSHVNKAQSLEAKVDGLIELVLERGAPDNVTIVLAQL